MDAFLARLGVQAVNYAMRCGIAITSSFALKQCSRLLKSIDDKIQKAELQRLQKTLDNKIKIISPALDLVEFRSSRGNEFLGHASTLAKALQRDITALGKRLEKAAAAEEQARNGVWAHLTAGQRRRELESIILDIQDLLARIDGDIPLLQLAITASGESLSTSLPPSISPSRLLQASMFLMIGDTQFANDPSRPVQIGPSFTLSLYMLFRGHSAPGEECPPYGLGDGERRPIWQEVLHKSRVRLCRIPCNWKFDPSTGYRPGHLSQQTRRDLFLPNSGLPLSDHEYVYHLELIEDLDDGRLHDTENADSFDNMGMAGVRESIPIQQIAKIFYTDTGRILNIGSANDNDMENNPVLLLKRDVKMEAEPMEPAEPSSEPESPPGNDPDSEQDSSDGDEQADIGRQLQAESAASGGQVKQRRWHLPQQLDAEWLALEVFVEDDDDAGTSNSSDAEDTEDDTENAGSNNTHSMQSCVDARLVEQMRNLSAGSTATLEDSQQTATSFAARSPFGAVTSSLSLLEMLVRLTSLQEFQQTSHLTIPDHILTFFLEETSTTGLQGEERWRAKKEAEERVGFDPYTDVSK